jgi:hypothetical protein
MNDIIDRIERLGYIQQVKKLKRKSNEGSDIYTDEAIEMPDEKGQKINEKRITDRKRSQSG